MFSLHGSYAIASVSRANGSHWHLADSYFVFSSRGCYTTAPLTGVEDPRPVAAPPGRYPDIVDVVRTRVVPAHELALQEDVPAPHAYRHAIGHVARPRDPEGAVLGGAERRVGDDPGAGALAAGKDARLAVVPPSYHHLLIRDITSPFIQQIQINGFTTAFAVFCIWSHWQNGGLHGGRHLYTDRQSHDNRQTRGK